MESVMPDAHRNVLRPDARTEQEQYRSAVAKIIFSIQAETAQTFAEIADTIDVSAATIANAANKRSDLSGVYLTRLRRMYGLAHFDPFASLFDAQFLERERSEIDALPPLSASVHRLAVAQSPDSEGGRLVTHREMLEMLPEMREAVRALNAMIAKAERIAA